MKSFEYASPSSLDEATSLLANQWGETEILAGGTDLITSIKQEITQPKRLVSLKNIAALKKIQVEGNELRVGAMATLGELARHDAVKRHFPAIATAINGIGSPQIIAAGTVGGDLCQRPRCWYFRNGFGLLAAKDGKSLAKDGENQYHAIFGNEGQACFVSASSLGPALIALGATLTAVGPNKKSRQIPADQFFKTPKNDTERETVLQPNEILSEIRVPMKGLRNATYEVRHRHGLDWPYVTATVAYRLTGRVASEAQVVLGHVAPTPWSAAKAAKALEAVPINDETAGKCGQAAVDGAKPLSDNAYKIQLVKTAVKRAVLAAGQA